MFLKFDRRHESILEATQDMAIQVARDIDISWIQHATWEPPVKGPYVTWSLYG